MYVFSYGSNMLISRIKDRIKGYRKIGIGYLPEHTLRFHKRSKDGSGKADAYFTGKEDQKVWGVIGQIDKEAKKILDKFEGLGRGYNEKVVEIITNDEKINTTIYVADSDCIDTNLIPFDWYKEFVVQGSIENQLPEDYIKLLKDIPCKKDFNIERREKNYTIMKKAGTELSDIKDVLQTKKFKGY